MKTRDLGIYSLPGKMCGYFIANPEIYKSYKRSDLGTGCFYSSRIQILRKLIGSLGSP